MPTEITFAYFATTAMWIYSHNGSIFIFANIHRDLIRFHKPLACSDMFSYHVSSLTKLESFFSNKSF